MDVPGRAGSRLSRDGCFRGAARARRDGRGGRRRGGPARRRHTPGPDRPGLARGGRGRPRELRARPAAWAAVPRRSRRTTPDPPGARAAGGALLRSVRRFLPYSLLGALTWAATFTVVGYVFASSFESAGEAAARIALGAAVLAAIALLVVARLRGTRRRPRGHEPLRDEGRQDPETRSDQRPGEDIERIVHTQVHPRESNRGSQTERPEAQFGAHERDHGRGPEGGGRVAGGERRVAGNRREGSEVGVGDRRTRAVEYLLEPVGGERGAEHRHGRGRGGDRQTPHTEVRAETQADKKRPLDPPGGQHDEDRSQYRVLE